MKPNPISMAGRLSVTILTLFLFSACAPAPSGPSSAWHQQLATIQQQQQELAAQLRVVQEQLAQLRPGSGTAGPITAIPSPLPASLPSATAKTSTLPAGTSAEIRELAGSAATYLAAFSDLAAERFASAETGFSLFLREYPGHQYAPNARYWLASAQASQNKLQDAIANLRQLVVADNGQNKTPAAMVLLAQIYRRQDWHNEADEILEQLRNRYPDSLEAQHAYQSDKPR